MSGRGTGLPVSSACQAWRLVVLVTACTARVDRTTDRSSMPPPASAVAASVSPARVRQVDLEGERSPGRTVLASFPVSNPERTARTRRWSKALKRPTRPGRAEFRYFRPQGWGKRHTAAPGGPIDAWGMFAATSVVVEASRWMCGGRPSNRSARAHRIGGGVRCLRPAAKAVGGCPEVGGTARGATAAVTRCGYRRGDSSRGTNCVAGMALRAATGFVRVASGTHGNATNPRIGSRLQYACDFRGR